jgi:hypothetical protein
MTRYNNPLPLNQVPNSQGRPAGSGAAQQPQQSYQQPNWPQQGAGSSRSGAQGYGDAGGYGSDHLSGAGRPAADPYAALRPDGYAYGQPQQPATSDPYGLAGYTAPQSQASFGSASRTQPSAPAPSYGTQASPSPYAGQQASPYGGQQSDPYGASRAPASSFGNSQAGYGSSSAGYGSLTAAPPQPSYGSQANSSAPPPAAYGASSMPPQPAYGSHASAAGGDQWSNSLSMDARDYGHDYQNAGQGHAVGHAPGQGGHWGGDHYGEPAMDANGAYAAASHAQHASFDQSYAEDDAHYEAAPHRGGWKKVIGLAACTVLLGGGLFIAYGSIMGSGETGDTPVIKSASGPSKVKPSDPGGRQFAHAESKLMGRLGEGGVDATPDQAGVRKVPVMTVGRDGSIQPPAAQPEETRAVVAVPGLTVIDGFGGGGPSESMPSPARSTSTAPNKPSQGSANAPLPVKMVSSSEETKPVVVAPPKKTVAEAPPAAPTPKKEKVAALTPPAASSSSGPKPTGAGYVAVLASVPASGSSRIEALKQFADMQQQYTSILSNKTPDVQEADLGEKGTYHRLLVGPPGSRESASSLCTQLKAQGYSGCWVTAY